MYVDEPPKDGNIPDFNISKIGICPFRTYQRSFRLFHGNFSKDIHLRSRLLCFTQNDYPGQTTEQRGMTKTHCCAYPPCREARKLTKQPISFAESICSKAIGDGRLALPTPLHEGASLRWQPLGCGYCSGFGKPASRTGNPKPYSHRGSHLRYAPLFRGLER